MSIRLRCDRLHDLTYESVRNSGKKVGLTEERNGVKKGQDSHRKIFAAGHGSRQMRRVCAVSFSDFLIASWWSHGAHMGPLWASFWGATLGSPPFLAAYDAICDFFVSGFIPHGPQLTSTSGSLQQHKGCGSCCNTAVAGMHSLGGWPLGHALEVEHLRLAWIFKLRDAHGTTAAFHAITRPTEATP